MKGHRGIPSFVEIYIGQLPTVQMRETDFFLFYFVYIISKSGDESFVYIILYFTKNFVV